MKSTHAVSAASSEALTSASTAVDLVHGPLREGPHEVGAGREMAVDGAADHAGSGGDVAHAGVGVLPQDLEGDVEDAIPRVVHRARPGGFGLHDSIIAHSCAMR